MALPVDPFLAAAVALLILGVVGSVAPMIPGVLLSVVGVVLYWWSTGYASPGVVFVAVVVVIGAVAMLVDLLAGAIAARAGGASLRTTAMAALVSLLLFVFLGPVGIIVGVALTVFLVELYRTRQVGASGRASLYATAGLLASTAVQFVLTVSILLGFLLVVLL